MIRIWDLNETKVKDWVQTTDIITALTFSPDQNFLLVGFVKGVVKIYKTDKVRRDLVSKNINFCSGKAEVLYGDYMQECFLLGKTK